MVNQKSLSIGVGVGLDLFQALCRGTMGNVVCKHNSGRCRNCPLDGKCLLSHLGPEEKAVWHDMLVPRCYKKNDFVFWEEGDAQGLYLVCSGAVKLIKSSAGGDQHIVRLAGPGSFFGLPPLRCERPQIFSAQAIARTELHFIPRDGFLYFLERFPHFALTLIDQLINQLSMTRLRLRDFGCKSGRQRIADLLLWLGQEFGTETEAGVEIGIELSRADLAGMAGLTPETTIRLLSSFRREGILGSSSRRLVLLDLEGLRAVSGVEGRLDLGFSGPI